MIFYRVSLIIVDDAQLRELSRGEGETSKATKGSKTKWFDVRAEDDEPFLDSSTKPRDRDENERKERKKFNSNYQKPTEEKKEKLN